MTVPGYWMHEARGVLRPAIESYLRGEPMSGENIAAMRAYLRQWIMSPVWDQNPYLTNPEIAELNMLRDGIAGLTTVEAIDSWLLDAANAGHDPL